MTVLRPSDAAYTAAARPAGPPPDDAHVVQRLLGRWCAARARRRPPASTASAACRRRGPAPAAGRPASRPASSRNRSASASRSTSYQRYGTWLRARNILISWLRSDHRCPTTRTSEVWSGLARRQSSSRSSMTGIEPLLRRVPRLEQVVVEADVVDRRDGHVGVGVRRQQQVLRPRRMSTRLLQQLDAGHLRHPLVGGDQRHRLVAQRQPGQHVQRLGPRRRAHDAVVGAVAAPQVAGDRGGDLWIVVDRQDGRFAHQISLTWRPCRLRPWLLPPHYVKFLAHAYFGGPSGAT